MKYLLVKSILLIVISIFISCDSNNDTMKSDNVKIIFLHHSTGNGVWRGSSNKYLYKITKRGDVENLIKKHNKNNKITFTIKEQAFPKKEPYGWKNYPFDYYNIWVKNAGDSPYIEESTLEILTKQYDVIVFKHCYPVSSIKENSDSADINSEIKTLENYKLQYNAIKEKLHSFPDTKFIIWTGAALVEAHTNEEEGKRSQEFSNWVKNDWNEKGDNVFVWDFRELETEGGLYLKSEYATNSTNSHPNNDFNAKAAKLFVNRLIDVIDNDGKSTSLIGEPLK